MSRFLRRTPRRPGDERNPSTLRERARSVWDHRSKREAPAELVLKAGQPVIVVSKGRPIGYRCTDGSVRPAPEQPVEAWLKEPWDTDDDDWMIVRGPRGWRR